MIATVFKPATALMGRLSYARKFAVIGVVLLAPLAYSVHAYLAEKGGSIGFGAKERVGVVYVRPAAALLGDLIRARSAVARGDGPALDQAKDALATDVPTLDAVDARLGGALHTTRQWSALERRIAAVTSAPPGTRGHAFRAYGRLTAAARDLIVTAGNYSNLILDQTSTRTT